MVNSQYLSNQTLDQVRKAFHANEELPSVTLQRFFDEKEYAQLSRDIAKAAFKKTVDKMHFSYNKAAIPSSLKKALQDKTLLTYISAITNKKASLLEGELCSFGWKDYTLLHDDNVEPAGIDIIIDFTSAWNEKAGGMIVYVDGTGNFHNIAPSENTLTITKRKEGVQKFVQYVNHYAKNEKRILFLGNCK